MTNRCLVAASWDFATYGTSTVAVADTIASGSISYATGKYEHGITGGTICTRAGVTTPTLTAFGSAFSTSLNALGGDSYAVQFSLATGKYTISAQFGNFSLTFTGAAGTLMRKLLGFSGDKSGAQSYTSDVVPWFALVPAKPGVTNYKQPARVAGSSSERVTDAGTPYVQKRTSTPQVASWEHHYEPKERADAIYLRDVASATSTHLYSWEQLWTDYGTARMPIGMYLEGADGNYEKLAYSLMAHEYDESVCQRLGRYDDKFTINVKARMWPTSTADQFARTFNT